MNDLVLAKLRPWLGFVRRWKKRHRRQGRDRIGCHGGSAQCDSSSHFAAQTWNGSDQGRLACATGSAAGCLGVSPPLSLPCSRPVPFGEFEKVEWESIIAVKSGYSRHNLIGYFYINAHPQSVSLAFDSLQELWLYKGRESIRKSIWDDEENSGEGFFDSRCVLEKVKEDL